MLPASMIHPILVFVRKDALGPWRFFTIGPAWTRSIHSNHGIHGAGWKLRGVFFEHLNDSVLWDISKFPETKSYPKYVGCRHQIQHITSLDIWGLHHQSIKFGMRYHHLKSIHLRYTSRIQRCWTCSFPKTVRHTLRLPTWLLKSTIISIV